jgi:hypothetical protein
MCVIYGHSSCSEKRIVEGYTITDGSDFEMEMGGRGSVGFQDLEIFLFDWLCLCPCN